MRAIAETGNTLVAALDPKDSVGVLDQHFPDAHFFVEFERFDRHVDKLRRRGTPIAFVSVCSPNYLHDAHVRFGLRAGANVICEKPLVLNPWNVDALADFERESGRRVYTILQLRLHPVIAALRERTQARAAGSPKVDVELTYVTSRGRWYHTSWKGDVARSGGVATNIGVHFFDMLQWVYGPVQESRVHLRTESAAAGYLELDGARVRWFLSIDAEDLPSSARARGQRTFRSIRIGGDELEFSEGFTDLHTASYRELLGGAGFGLHDAKPSIELVHALRETELSGGTSLVHPMVLLRAR
jgi:UDP-N-acetyl-2-amino-2-deoxyglucuronate dehydrogenase